MNKRETRAAARAAQKEEAANLGRAANGDVIPVPGAGAVPAPNIAQPDQKPEEAAQTALVSKVAAAILAALETDAALETELANRKAAGASTLWTLVQGQVRAVACDAALGTLKHRGALLADVLDRIKAAGMAAGAGPLKVRTSQYAADYGKAVRAMRKDKEVPEGLWTASRAAWNGDTFWTDAGAKSARGRKGKTPAVTPPAPATDAELGAALEKATKDKAFSSLMSIFAGLRGPFRAEFLKGATELASAILARQAQAQEGGGRR
jgi:hypothetical protein